MTTEKSPSVRIREFGLYELQPTLPGLLAETVRFFNQHHIDKPLAFTPVQGPRGWTAEIELTWADLCRVLEDFPIAASWSLESIEGIETLVVDIELRSGRLRSMISKEHIDAKMTSSGLLMHLDSGRIVRSSSGSRRVSVQTTTGLKP